MVIQNGLICTGEYNNVGLHVKLKKMCFYPCSPKDFEKRLLVLLCVPFAHLSCGTSRLSLE